MVIAEGCPKVAGFIGDRRRRMAEARHIGGCHGPRNTDGETRACL